MKFNILQLHQDRYTRLLGGEPHAHGLIGEDDDDVGLFARSDVGDGIPGLPAEPDRITKAIMAGDLAVRRNLVQPHFQFGGEGEEAAGHEARKDGDVMALPAQFKAKVVRR